MLSNLGKKIFLHLTVSLDDIIKIQESLEKSNLLIYSATETLKQEIKNKKVVFLSFDGTYGFFIDTTYGFFIDKYCNWKRTRRLISSIIIIAFNDEFWKKSQKSRKSI